MKIGFIGLGIMGKPMAKNLLKAGYELIVTTHKQATIDEMVAAGAKGAANGKEVAAQCDVVITMLPNSPNVRDAVLGKNGATGTECVLTNKDGAGQDAAREKDGGRYRTRTCDILRVRQTLFR